MSEIQIKVNDIKINKVNDTAKYFIIIPQNIFKVCCFMKTILYKPKTFPFEFIKQNETDDMGE